MLMQQQVGEYAQASPRPAKGHSNGGNGKHFCTQMDRIGRLEDGLLSLTGDVSDLRQTIGKPPSLDGKPGTGMAGVLYRLANHAMFGTPRGAMESLVDDEGEITKIQSREDLIMRAKVAEAELAARARNSDHARSDKRERWKLIGTVAAAAVGGGGLLGVMQLLSSCVGG